MIIGIDPDIEKSGVACIVNGKLKTECESFYNIINAARLRMEVYESKNHYFVEAGWLNKKSNWHSYKTNLSPAQDKARAERVSKNVGENHAVGKLLVECLRAIGHEVTEVKPTRSKLDAKQFKAVTGYEGRTNQEQRDAAMLIWHLRNSNT